MILLKKKKQLSTNIDKVYRFVLNCIEYSIGILIYWLYVYSTEYYCKYKNEIVKIYCMHLNVFFFDNAKLVF